MFDEKTKKTLANLEEARACTERARSFVMESEAAEQIALMSVVDAFTDAYFALPTNIRNKIRHVINTTAKNPE